MKRLAATALLLMAVACGTSPATPADPIVVALASSPVNLDPAVGLDESSQKLHQLLYRSLLKTDADLRVVPDLAVRFETADSQTYVAEIPRGVLFHDGKRSTFSQYKCSWPAGTKKSSAKI